MRPLLHGRLGELLVGISAFELGNAAATLLILRATELLTPAHGHVAAVKIALGLYALYNLAATLIAIPGGRLNDRRGSLLVLALGAAAFTGSFAGLALTNSRITLIALFFVLGGLGGLGLGETAQSAAVATLAPVELRGSAFGLVAAIQSFANLTASAIAGLLWTLVSARAGLLYLAGWSTLALLAFTLTGTTRRRDSQNPRQRLPNTTDRRGR